MSTTTLLISKKIKDMQFILKVTEALQLISSAKLRNYRQILHKSRDYCNGIKFLFQKFYSCYEHDYRLSNQKFLLDPVLVRKSNFLVIAIGTDLALCGRFNKQIVDYLKTHFREDTLLIVFGRKLFSLLSNTKFKENIIKSYNSEQTISELAKTIEEATQYFLKEYINRGCYHLQIVHKATNKPFKLKKLLPFTSDYFGPPVRTIKYETHECKLNIFDSIVELFPSFAERALFLSLVESKIAEHNQRRDVMNNAVKAAEEKLSEYRLIYQKMKQAGITQEISEITAAIKCKN